MKLFPSRREVHRAQARLVGRLYGVLLLVTLLFAVFLVGRYGVNLW